MKNDIKQIISEHPHIKKSISEKSNFPDYIEKIMSNAVIIPYYSKSYLRGFIAYYANDVLKQDAYLTIIIIDKKIQGEGLGKLLLKSSILDLISKGYCNYSLEVLKSNRYAIEFYKKHGFIIEKNTEFSCLMTLKLKEYEESSLK